MRPQSLVGAFLALVLFATAVAGCGTAPASSPTSTPAAAAQAAQPVSSSPTVAATAVAVQPTSSSNTVSTKAAEPTASSNAISKGGVLTVALSSEPSKLDPHRTAAVNAILVLMQACESLVIEKQDGSFAPGLAKSWEISDDGKSYTFHLRQGVKFHDGTPFNAEAVKYNFDRAVDPATQSEGAIDMLGPYLDTQVVDDQTAMVHLKSPFAPLLDGIAEGSLCMISPTTAKKWGPEEFQDHFVGTGPFVFKEYVRHEQITLERNPDYWGGPEFFAHQGLAYLDKLVFKFVTEASVRSGILETGEVQVIQDVPAVDVKRLNSEPNIHVVSSGFSGTPVLLLFNMSKAPTNDLKVRQAINYAIDQKTIPETLYQGAYEPAYGALSPITACYWSGGEKMYPYDPAKAKALLEEAGWKDTNGDGIREKDGQPLRLEFPTNSGNGRFRDPAPMVQEALAQVGIEVNVTPSPAASWIAAGKSGNQQIGIMQWTLRDPGTSLDALFNSKNSGAFAWNKHTNSKLDGLLDQGLTVTDPSKRCAVYEDVQKIIMEDAMMKPLHLWSSLWGTRSSVNGFKVYEANPGYFWLFDTYLTKQ